MEKYPEVLKVEHIAEIMGVGKIKAYDIMEMEGFPLVRVGRLKRVPRDRFFQWLDEQSRKVN